MFDDQRQICHQIAIEMGTSWFGMGYPANLECRSAFQTCQLPQRKANYVLQSKVTNRIPLPKASTRYTDSTLGNGKVQQTRYTRLRSDRLQKGGSSQALWQPSKIGRLIAGRHPSIETTFMDLSGDVRNPLRCHSIFGPARKVTGPHAGCRTSSSTGAGRL